MGGEAGGEGALDVFFHAVAGEGDAAEGGVVEAEAGDEVEAGAVGEAEVGDDGVVVGAAGGDGAEGFGDGACSGDAVASAEEEALHDFASGGVVFDEEDVEGGRAGEVNGGGGRWGFDLGEAGAGEVEGEDGAGIRAFAVTADLALVVLNDGAGDGQAEAEAAEAVFAGKGALVEGLEEAFG